MKRPDVRLVRLAEQLHDLGPLPLAHLLAEIEAGADPRPRIESYARLPAAFIEALSGHRRDPSLFSVRRPQ